MFQITIIHPILLAVNVCRLSLNRAPANAVLSSLLFKHLLCCAPRCCPALASSALTCLRYLGLGRNWLSLWHGLQQLAVLAALIAFKAEG